MTSATCFSASSTRCTSSGNQVKGTKKSVDVTPYSTRVGRPHRQLSGETPFRNASLGLRESVDVAAVISDVGIEVAWIEDSSAFEHIAEQKDERDPTRFRSAVGESQRAGRSGGEDHADDSRLGSHVSETEGIETEPESLAARQNERHGKRAENAEPQPPRDDENTWDEESRVESRVWWEG